MNNQLISNNTLNNLQINSVLILTKHRLQIDFSIEGALSEYSFPKVRKRERVNELWKGTCFELFLGNTQREAYYELNFSPSLGWNFYYLSTYRSKVEIFKLNNNPVIEIQTSEHVLKISFVLEIEELFLDEFDIYNVATILLSQENERTFWSIKHDQNVPNFHNRANFLKIK
ncbi:MAG: Unknown protein [uncultured Sulfurovum sp.]|uniref:DOMON-like domain-containing protein n=1 Tax=uncultured Sulfurovum sp. TaxID=269237 RepID=A0A6S6SKK4_9BACT|nr:MAG: Unknown protein [uncultured Sulfurovum sp.]